MPRSRSPRPRQTRKLHPTDAARIAWAVSHLERDTVGQRLLDVMGTPVDAGLKLSSAKMQQHIDTVVRLCMVQGLRFARGSLCLHGPPKAQGWLTQVAATTTGFVSGLFGLVSIPAELPVISILILRAIAEVSLDFSTPAEEERRRLECLFVLSLGGRVKSPEDEFFYWSVRDKFHPMLLEAGRSIVSTSGSGVPAKALTALLQQGMGSVTSQIYEHLLTRAIPILGAFTGAAMNFFLVTHYRKLAKAHFLLLHLEEKYGRPLVYQHYHHATQKI